jgi:hypothetical protein
VQLLDRHGRADQALGQVELAKGTTLALSADGQRSAFRPVSYPFSCCSTGRRDSVKDSLKKGVWVDASYTNLPCCSDHREGEEGTQGVLIVLSVGPGS